MTTKAKPTDDSFHVFDTTLRDGAQREGINLTVADKLTIARHLDDFGVGFIEGGGGVAGRGRGVRGSGRSGGSRAAVVRRGGVL
ncbi:hypothetical protein, partial [Streptomyces sp. NPDC002346]